MKIHIVLGDIFEQDTDVIVNPANKSLLAGGGLCGEIFRRAGKNELELECKTLLHEKQLSRLKVGDAIITNAYNLPFKAIIHAIGPQYHIDRTSLLKFTYLNSLNLAFERNYSSIVFPGIGIGINNIPFEVSAQSAKKALKEFESKLHTVVFVLNYYEAYNVFKKSFKED